MHKQEKAELVGSLSERFRSLKAAIVTEYRGLTVEQMTGLRKKVRQADGALRVVKNRLAKRAFQGASVTGLDDFLVGPTALATAVKDPVPLAKALVDFAKANDLFKIKGGVVEGKVLNTAQLTALAKLPSREELLSQLLSVMNGPARQLATVLAAVPRGLVTAIKAIGDKKNA